MLLPLDYQIKYVEGQYHLYVIMEGTTCAVLHSDYLYKPCYEAMQCAKNMQKLVTVEGNT